MFSLCFIEHFYEKYHLLSIFCTAKYKVNSINTRVKVVPMHCQNHIHVYLLVIFRFHFKECQQEGGGLAGTRDLGPFSDGKRDFKANLAGKRDF